MQSQAIPSINKPPPSTTDGSDRNQLISSSSRGGVGTMVVATGISGNSGGVRNGTIWSTGNEATKMAKGSIRKVPGTAMARTMRRTTTTTTTTTLTVGQSSSSSRHPSQLPVPILTTRNPNLNHDRTIKYNNSNMNSTNNLKPNNVKVRNDSKFHKTSRNGIGHRAEPIFKTSARTKVNTNINTKARDSGIHGNYGDLESVIKRNPIGLMEKVKRSGGPIGYPLGGTITAGLDKGGEAKDKGGGIDEVQESQTRGRKGVKRSRSYRNSNDNKNRNQSTISKSSIFATPMLGPIPPKQRDRDFSTPAPLRGQVGTKSSIHNRRRNVVNPYLSVRRSVPKSAYNSARLKNSSSLYCSSSRAQPPSHRHVVASVSEGRSGDVCVSSIDASLPCALRVALPSDVSRTGGGGGGGVGRRSRNDALAYLECLRPDEVLLNEGRKKGSGLAEEIERIFMTEGDNERNGNSGEDREIPNVAIQYLPRSMFDPSGVTDILRRTVRGGVLPSALDDGSGVIAIGRGKSGGRGEGGEGVNGCHYAPRSSIGAVLRYVTLSLGTNVMEGTLSVDFVRGGWGRVSIDPDTLRHLEVFGDARNGKVGGGGSNSRGKRGGKIGGGLIRGGTSLIGTIDCCRTGPGRRLLRSSLMAPPGERVTIESRLDLVDAFLEDEDFFYTVLDGLESLPDLDGMMSYLSLIPKKKISKDLFATSNTGRGGGGSGGIGKTGVTARMAGRGISALVCIKTALAAVPDLAKALEGRWKEMVRNDRTKMDMTVEGTGKRTTSKVFSVPLSGCPLNAANSSDNDRSDDDVGGEEDEYDEEQNEFLISLALGCGTPHTPRTPRLKVKKSSPHSHSASTIASSTYTTFMDPSFPAVVKTPVVKTTGTSVPDTPFPESKSGRQHPHHRLLRAVILAMGRPSLTIVSNAVSNIFTESTYYVKNRHAMRHQECFALKPNTDGMMDVIRKAFLANVDDVYKLADKYAEQFNTTVTVRETTARGYFLSLPGKMEHNLPDIFIQPVKQGGKINCTTEEVHSLNARAKENVQDLLLMTHERIKEVTDIVRANYDAIASLVDAIALIDLCHCFADNVASSQLPWCRPIVTEAADKVEKVTEEGGDYLVISNGNDSKKGKEEDNRKIPKNGTIAIRGLRHPLHGSGSGLISEDGTFDQSFVPNDVYSSQSCNFTIVSGVNGSGKSTYLRSIALAFILAHCGSYVPAIEMRIPSTDRIVARMGTSDDPQHNVSSFLREMGETAYLCDSATARTLVLIDELGRATSNEDGVSIAWAVSEHLLTRGCPTFFVTHYSQLVSMANIYPERVQNQHLGAVIVPGRAGRSEHADEEDDILGGNDNDIVTQGEVRYSYKILPGPCTIAEDYGVEMASTCGWENSVVNMARSIRKSIEGRLPHGGISICSKINDREKNICQIAQKALTNLTKDLVAFSIGTGISNKEKVSNSNCLTTEAKLSYLQDLRERFWSSEKDPKVVNMIWNLLKEDDEKMVDEDCNEQIHNSAHPPILLPSVPLICAKVMTINPKEKLLRHTCTVTRDCGSAVSNINGNTHTYQSSNIIDRHNSSQVTRRHWVSGEMSTVNSDSQKKKPGIECQNRRNTKLNSSELKIGSEFKTNFKPTIIASQLEYPTEINIVDSTSNTITDAATQRQGFSLSRSKLYNSNNSGGKEGSTGRSKEDDVDHNISSDGTSSDDSSQSYESSSTLTSLRVDNVDANIRIDDTSFNNQSYSSSSSSSTNDTSNVTGLTSSDSSSSISSLGSSKDFVP